MASSTTTEKREDLRHSTHLHGLELRWNGARGPIVIYSRDGEVLQAWTREENKDGKALGDAIFWAKKRLVTPPEAQEAPKPATQPEPEV